MKPRREEQKLTEAQGTAKKPRFHIEKLEERIAPHHSCHLNSQGEPVGHCKFRPRR